MALTDRTSAAADAEKPSREAPPPTLARRCRNLMRNYDDMASQQRELADIAGC